MALWMVAGLVFSEGKNRSSAALTEAVRDTRKASRSNFPFFADELGRLDADMRGRVLGHGARGSKFESQNFYCNPAGVR